MWEKKENSNRILWLFWRNSEQNRIKHLKTEFIFKRCFDVCITQILYDNILFVPNSFLFYNKSQRVTKQMNGLLVLRFAWIFGFYTKKYLYIKEIINSKRKWKKFHRLNLFSFSSNYIFYHWSLRIVSAVKFCQHLFLSNSNEKRFGSFL